GRWRVARAAAGRAAIQRSRETQPRDANPSPRYFVTIHPASRTGCRRILLFLQRELGAAVRRVVWMSGFLLADMAQDYNPPVLAAAELAGQDVRLTAAPARPASASRCGHLHHPPNWSRPC